MNKFESSSTRTGGYEDSVDTKEERLREKRSVAAKKGSVTRLALRKHLTSEDLEINRLKKHITSSESRISFFFEPHGVIANLFRQENALKSSEQIQLESDLNKVREKLARLEAERESKRKEFLKERKRAKC